MSREDDTHGSGAPQRQDFRPGHSVHWIQAGKAAEYRHQAEKGRIIKVGGSDLLVRVDGAARRYAVEDPDRLAWLEQIVGVRGTDLGS